MKDFIYLPSCYSCFHIIIADPQDPLIIRPETTPHSNDTSTSAEAKPQEKVSGYELPQVSDGTSDQKLPETFEKNSKLVELCSITENVDITGKNLDLSSFQFESGREECVDLINTSIKETHESSESESEYEDVIEEQDNDDEEYESANEEDLTVMLDKTFSENRPCSKDEPHVLSEINSALYLTVKSPPLPDIQPISEIASDHEIEVDIYSESSEHAECADIRKNEEQKMDRKEIQETEPLFDLIYKGEQSFDTKRCLKEKVSEIQKGMPEVTFPIENETNLAKIQFTDQPTILSSPDDMDFWASRESPPLRSKANSVNMKFSSEEHEPSVIGKDQEAAAEEQDGVIKIDFCAQRESPSLRSKEKSVTIAEAMDQVGVEIANTTIGVGATVVSSTDEVLTIISETSRYDSDGLMTTVPDKKVTKEIFAKGSEITLAKEAGGQELKRSSVFESIIGDNIIDSCSGAVIIPEIQTADSADEYQSVMPKNKLLEDSLQSSNQADDTVIENTPLERDVDLDEVDFWADREYPPLRSKAISANMKFSSEEQSDLGKLEEAKLQENYSGEIMVSVSQAESLEVNALFESADQTHEFNIVNEDSFSSDNGIPLELRQDEDDKQLQVHGDNESKAEEAQVACAPLLTILVDEQSANRSDQVSVLKEEKDIIETDFWAGRESPPLRPKETSVTIVESMEQVGVEDANSTIGEGVTGESITDEGPTIIGEALQFVSDRLMTTVPDEKVTSETFANGAEIQEITSVQEAGSQEEYRSSVSAPIIADNTNDSCSGAVVIPEIQTVGSADEVQSVMSKNKLPEDISQSSNQADDTVIENAPLERDADLGEVDFWADRESPPLRSKAISANIKFSSEKQCDLGKLQEDKLQENYSGEVMVSVPQAESLEVNALFESANQTHEANIVREDSFSSDKGIPLGLRQDEEDKKLQVQGNNESAAEDEQVACAPLLTIPVDEQSANRSVQVSVVEEEKDVIETDFWAGRDSPPLRPKETSVTIVKSIEQVGVEDAKSTIGEGVTGESITDEVLTIIGETLPFDSDRLMTTVPDEKVTCETFANGAEIQEIASVQEAGSQEEDRSSVSAPIIADNTIDSCSSAVIIPDIQTVESADEVQSVMSKNKLLEGSSQSSNQADDTVIENTPLERDADLGEVDFWADRESPPLRSKAISANMKFSLGCTNHYFARIIFLQLIFF